MSALDVVVVGSLNLDLVARADRLPGPGETVHGSTYTEVAGGKGLNQAVAAARSGAAVAFVGAVGGDEAGARLRAVAQREGIDVTRITAVASQPSGRALIAVDRHGENSIIVVAGANAHVTLDELPAASVVLAQLETNTDVVLATLRAARAAGSTTMLDPAPADRIPDGLLQLCDVVVPNEHEVELLGGVDALLDAGVRTIVVTRGAAGVDVFEAGSATWHLDADPVTAVDTTGAGDAFCGTLAARLAVGADLADAVRFATASGALAASRHGAVPSLPHLDEIVALVDGRQPQGDSGDCASDRTGPVPSTADAVSAYLASFATADPDAVARHVTDDFVNDHASALGSRSVGSDEYRRRLADFLPSFPGLRYEVEDIVAEGSQAAAAYRMRATSNGWPIDIRGVMLIEIRDGKVAQRTDYWDALTYLGQTGRAIDI